MRITLTLLCLALAIAGVSQQTFDRKALYDAMRLDDKNLVNRQLQYIGQVPAENRQAFEGALLMKKAGLGGIPTKKLSLFKDGHRKLEAAIKSAPSNAEYRFLRLMIQEHAPGILGYKNDMKGDDQIIQKSYKSLPPDVQHAIADYSKKSKVLHVKIS